MTSRTLAIGDIHGCAQALDALLNVLSPTSDDTVVTLGDYVDRGPQSRQVIDRLLELERSTQLVPLIGNHEQMMLQVIADQAAPQMWLRYGGIETLDSYGFTGDLDCVPASHRDFLTRLRSYHETPDHFFIHANYDPRLPLDEQPDRLARWVSLRESVPPPHISGRRAVVGHTADEGGEIFDVGHLVCIDTYCYGGRWLTAIDVESGQVWQVNPRGELRENS